jgi:hypothetical protein
MRCRRPKGAWLIGHRAQTRRALIARSSGCLARPRGRRRQTELTDPLDANERQQGQYRSSRQVKTSMPGDRGHPRAMRLLPFAAAVAADQMALSVKVELSLPRFPDTLIIPGFPEGAWAADICHT